MGRDQRGTASVYAGRFHGRKTADGTRFDAGSNTAASKTLPLGTTARVTNLETGKTATVQVRDRGPHRADRIIDVSPGTAGTLGMNRNGTAPVAVTPIAPPGGQGK
jgi:rare lipoprotein A